MANRGTTSIRSRSVNRPAEMDHLTAKNLTDGKMHPPAISATPRRAFGDLKNPQQSNSQTELDKGSALKNSASNEDLKSPMTHALDEPVSAMVTQPGFRVWKDSEFEAEVDELLSKQVDNCDLIDPDAPVERFNWSEPDYVAMVQEDLDRILGLEEERLSSDTFPNLLKTIARTKYLFRGWLTEAEIAQLDGDLIPDPFADEAPVQVGN